MQPRFINFLIAGAFLLCASDSRPDLPDRQPMPQKVAAVSYQPVDLGPAEGVKLTGAWAMNADDPRFFGLSALATLLDGRLQALSDSGVRISFPKPGRPGLATFADLPDGPGYATFKRFRDSEAMVVDLDGLGAFVAFENRHSVWRYDWNGTGAPIPVPLPSSRWKANKGIEAMVEDRSDGSMLLIPESGREVLRVWDSMVPDGLPLTGATGGIADAARLPDERMIVAVREVGLPGLTNRLAWLERADAGYRLRTFATLPLGPFDNVEGLAAERGPNGSTILWAVTDDDGWRRTLLLRMELETTKAPAKAEASSR